MATSQFLTATYVSRTISAISLNDLPALRWYAATYFLAVFPSVSFLARRTSSSALVPGRKPSPAGTEPLRPMPSLAVPDYNTGRQELLARCQFFSALIEPLYGPYYVAYSPSGGRIAVADIGNHRVQLFYPNGTFAGKFGSSGSADGEFKYGPYGIAYSPSGDRIAVADIGNHRVQLFYPNGTFAGKFGSSGSADGQWQFNYRYSQCFWRKPENATGRLEARNARGQAGKGWGL